MIHFHIEHRKGFLLKTLPVPPWLHLACSDDIRNPSVLTARDEICDAGDYSHSPDFGDYSAPDEPDERDTDRKTMTRVGTTVAAIIFPFRPYPLSLFTFSSRFWAAV